MLQVYGTVAEGFEEVKDEFERNFQERGELGAAVTAYYQGEKVVDLWGGVRDVKTNAPWEEDTMVIVFSTTKGIAATALALAHSRGYFDYEEKVATYWPEFGCNGKEQITVRQLLNHQAGLSSLWELRFRQPQDLATEKVAAQLASYRPIWEPGTRQGYHAWTIGWWMSELLRRVDPLGRSLGRFFREEIASPMDLQFYIGVPDEIPDEKIATLYGINYITPLLLVTPYMPRETVRYLLKPGSISMRSMIDKRFFVRNRNFNQRSMRQIEIPSVNGIGQVRSIARLYSELALGGRKLGIDSQTLKLFEETPIPPTSGKKDEVLRVETAYQLGFMKQSESNRLGGSLESYGSPGVGGSLGFADPEWGIGYSYAMNKFVLRGLIEDPKELLLRKALYRCVARKRNESIEIVNRRF